MKLESFHHIPGPVLKVTSWTLAAVIFFSNLVAMPGPHSLFGFAFVLYKYVLFATMTLPVILILFAVLWFFVQACRSYRVFWPMWLSLLILAVLLLNAVFIQSSLQTIARRKVVDEGKDVVAAIKAYHTASGTYPDDLSQLVPEFADQDPSPSIIGIKSFHYARTDSGFNVSFYEDFAPFLDYYMVTYLPAGPPRRDESAWQSLDSTGWWIVYVD